MERANGTSSEFAWKSRKWARSIGMPEAFTILILLLLSAWPASPETIENGDILLQYEAGGYMLGFGKSTMYVASADHMLKVDFLGGEPVTPVAEESAGGPGRPRSLNRVTYPGVWNEVTLVFEQSGGAIVKSNYHIDADAGGWPVDRIRLRYNRPVHLTSNGDLVTTFSTGEMVEGAPVAWQEIEGERRSVAVSYRIFGEREVGFRVGNYDPRAALVIDPPLTWNTFLGGSGTDYGQAIAVDGDGNVYVAGRSTATWGSPLRAYSSSTDAFAAKLASDGSLAWNTFLGGGGNDFGYAVAVDGSGNVYVGGYSNATWGSPARAFTSGQDAFAAKLANDGSLTWNTFLGGSGDDFGRGVGVDGSGNVHVGGFSGATWGSPVRAYTADRDAFAAMLTSLGSLSWNTFLGGSGTDEGWAAAVDGSGNMVVGGYSNATWGSPVRVFTSGDDAFAAKLASDGSLTWNTFLGGSGNDSGYGIALDGIGNVHVGGESSATWGSPVRAFTAADAFAAKLSNIGSLTWNTFLGGGGGSDYGTSITVDGSDNVYVGGASSNDWGSPVRPYSSGYDAFAAKLGNSGSLTWSTFLGGSGADRGLAIAVDASRNVYLGGRSSATWESPVRAYTAGDDAFVAELPETPTLVELVSFDAVPAVDHILLTWETASEIDNAGFHLWRGEEKGEEYIRITKHLIPAEGGFSWGAEYEYDDFDVTPGQTYYYKLEDIDNIGNSSFHGPVSATLIFEDIRFRPHQDESSQ